MHNRNLKIGRRLLALLTMGGMLLGGCAAKPAATAGTSAVAAEASTAAVETSAATVEASAASIESSAATVKTDAATVETGAATSETSAATAESDAVGKPEEQTPVFNSENQAYWREVLQKYRKDDGVRQVMLVRCTEGSNAIVQFYDKQTDQKNAWSLVFETDAYIGKNGAGKTQEGDAKTPLGDFGVLYSFGILNDPGTALDYLDITETTYACDEEGEYYNQIIDTVATGHDCTGEEMYLYTPEYNYGIVMDYNAKGEWPKGSEIFLHCKGAKVFTGGCVAIDEAYMRTVLQYAEPGMRIIIHEEYADQPDTGEEKTADNAVVNDGKSTDGKTADGGTATGKVLGNAVTATVLPEWNPESPAMKSLVEFVESSVDEQSEGYIPVQDRIAVFDMDGTLTCESFFTYYDTMMFIEFCLNDHPERVSEELRQAALELKPGYVADEALARNFAKAYAGMTVEELYDYAVEFGQKKTASFQNMRYLDGCYLPMVEVVKYLYDNDYTVYVISGTERTTSRAIVDHSPLREYVSPAHVIGTEFEVKVRGYEDVPSNMDFKYADGDDLVFTGGFIQKNLNANKAIWIEREIGQRPVLAFGNSGSDTSMLNYTMDERNPYPSAAYMVVADDDVREWGTQDWAEKSAEYEAQGYVPISMKDDFVRIYPDAVTKADQQYVEPQYETDEQYEELKAAA